MPKHVMFCVNGFSGSGKDEFVKKIVGGFGAVQTGLADPAKRHMADVYGFTEEQLFGPSKARNGGDLRHPKNTFRELGLRKWIGGLPPQEALLDGALDPEMDYWTYSGRDHGLKYPVAARLDDDAMTAFVKAGDPRYWLSPRESLQIYCETLNNLDINTWIKKGVDTHVKIAAGRSYGKMTGLTNGPLRTHIKPTFITCFSDFRHIHEFKYVREATADFVPVLVRIKRSSIPRAPYEHRSETEQTRIRDAAFDFVVQNDGTIPELHDAAGKFANAASTPGWLPKKWDDSYVLDSVADGYVP